MRDDISRHGNVETMTAAACADCGLLPIGSKRTAIVATGTDESELLELLLVTWPC